MKGQSVYKVPNGKLVKVSLEAGQGKVKKVKVSGDFFIHPEEAIDALEENLKGVELREDVLEKKILAIVEENSIQLFGFKSKDLAKAIMMAVGG